jgi:hypothetical protein
MPSDFSAMGKAARERISVPAAPMESILSRSHAAEARDRARSLIVGAVLALAVMGIAAGYAKKIYDGVHVWLFGGKAAVTVRSLVLVNEPQAADLRTAVSKATFRVILPVGFPKGTRMTRIAFAPADHPNSLTIWYRSGHPNRLATFTLLDASAITRDETLPAGVRVGNLHGYYLWHVGDETIFGGNARRVKDATSRVTAAQSLTQAEGMLAKITILGGSYDVADVAEGIAPRSGLSVLVDRGHLNLIWALGIASLAKQHRPMLDSRTVYLSDIPLVNGQPDYNKATLAWTKTIAISARGVQAIDAVLKATGEEAKPYACDCEILFNQPNAHEYWIWKILIPAPHRVTKYVVDSRTFAVTRS